MAEATEILPLLGYRCLASLVVFRLVGSAGGGWVRCHIHPEIWLTVVIQPLLVHVGRGWRGEVLLLEAHGESEMCSLLAYQ